MSGAIGNKKPFQLSITDLSDDRNYSMTVWVDKDEYTERPVESYRTLNFKFSQLCAALLVSGVPPEVSAQVIDVSQNEKPQE